MNQRSSQELILNPGWVLPTLMSWNPHLFLSSWPATVANNLIDVLLSDWKVRTESETYPLLLQSLQRPNKRNIFSALCICGFGQSKQSRVPIGSTLGCMRQAELITLIIICNSSQSLTVLEHVFGVSPKWLTVLQSLHHTFNFIDERQILYVSKDVALELRQEEAADFINPPE